MGNNPRRFPPILSPARLGLGSGPGPPHSPALGFGGKRFQPWFLLFVPGCGCLELGFNFPTPAASRRSPAGGAKSELSERMPQSLLVFLSWASESGVLGSSKTGFVVISPQKAKS